MRTSTHGEIARHARFHEFKDIDYFKQIFKGCNDLQLKEILPNYIHKISTRFLDHDHYIYLIDRPVDGI